MTIGQITRLYEAFRARVQDDRGASVIEYALLVTFIAVVAFIAVTVLGVETASAISGVTEGL